MPETPTRSADVQQCIEHLEKTAEEMLSDTQKRVAALRDLADRLSRRECLRSDVERKTPLEFEEGGIFGGV
jgi:hypothetical protein